MIRVVHPGSQIRRLTFYPSRITNPKNIYLNLFREEKRARVDRNHARNGEPGPSRRLRWRISEAAFQRSENLLIISNITPLYCEMHPDPQ
jgi:hypothetical protein